MSTHELEPNNVYVQDLGTTLQIHDVSHCGQYLIPPARDIEGSTKSRLLKISSTYTTRANRTLAALESIDQETRALFGAKQDAYDNFSFRLLQNEHTTIVTDDRIDHFVVLSYACHSPLWKPHSSIMPLHKDANSPLTPAMWAALLAQLHESECFWIDQLCINQDSESERTAAIGSMDLVYQCAQKVIVALEDIALTTMDTDLMFMYASTEAFRRQTPEHDRQALASVFGKIVAARWFDRAWCLHEFLVSRRHIFLVPISHVGCPTVSEGSSTTIMRIDGPFLVELYHVFIEQDIKHQNTGQESLLSTNQFTGIEINKFRLFFNRLRALGLHAVLGSEERPPEDGSFMHMFQQVFSHEAMYNVDKVSIILNAMRCGVYLKYSASFSEDECLWLVTLVAMAAGDTTTLTTNGPRCIDNENQPRTNRQWLRIPVGEDQARRMGALTIPRTIMDVKVVEDGLELDFLFLGTDAALNPPPKHLLSIARWFIDHRALSMMFADEQEMRLDTEPDEALYAKLRITYIQALACALACGKDWMLLYHVKSHVSLPSGIHLQWSPSSKEQFTKAIDWGLGTAIEQDVGDDLRETWQDGGTLMWADDAPPMQEETASDDLADEPYSPLNQEEQLCYNILLDFTETLVNFGLAVFPGSNGAEVTRETWSVQMLDAPEASAALVYAPAAETHGALHLGVPKALRSDAYDWMTRLWLLREDKKKESGSRYCLCGKSRLAGISPLPLRPDMRVIVVGER